MTDDPRVRVPLNGKRVDLEQLTAEVGTALCASPDEVVVADPAAKVTGTQLAAAVKAHVPPPVVDPDAAFVAAVEAATSLAALKAAIVGKIGPGAQPRRPDTSL